MPKSLEKKERKKNPESCFYLSTFPYETPVLYIPHLTDTSNLQGVLFVKLSKVYISSCIIEAFHGINIKENTWTSSPQSELLNIQTAWVKSYIQNYYISHTGWTLSGIAMKFKWPYHHIHCFLSYQLILQQDLRPESKRKPSNQSRSDWQS